MKHSALITTVLALIISACGNAIFEAKQDLPQNQWIRNNPSEFIFEITSPDIVCNITYHTRYAIAYPYYNLYVTAELSDGAGNVLASKVHEVNLFDPQSGKPQGKGLGNLFEKEAILFEHYKFPVKGIYRLRLQHYMRPDTLTSISAVGIAIRPAQ
ncbi:gliding motility lipoprotein GldH [Rhodoflexus sp.]